jgi:hypothetical protein
MESSRVRRLTWKTEHHVSALKVSRQAMIGTAVKKDVLFPPALSPTLDGCQQRCKAAGAGQDRMPDSSLKCRLEWVQPERLEVRSEETAGEKENR